MYRLRLQVSCPWRRLRPPPVPTGHGERSEGETLKLLTDCEGGAGRGRATRKPRGPLPPRRPDEEEVGSGRLRPPPWLPLPPPPLVAREEC